jgi:hypothetical protein
MTIYTTELFLVIGGHYCRDTKETCSTLECVVTQVMGARYKVRPLSELVTQMQESLLCLLIIVRSNPKLMLA